MSGDTGPFFMDPTDNPTFTDLEFIDQSLVKPRLPSQMPKILRELWRKAVSYHNLRVYNIDSQGYIKGETQSGSGSSITRNENVELVIIDKDATGGKSLPVDMDDEICDDGLRNKTTENIDDVISQLYRKCGYLMGCIGEPDDCMENRNCRILVGWSIYRDQVQFEVLIARRIYVAVGISKDVKMGDDSVTECVRENGEVFGYTSWNYNRKGVKGNKRMRSCNPMQEFEGGIKETNDFLMYCSWKRPSVTKVKGITFNLGDPHYLLVAEGDYSSSGVLGNVGKHVESHVFSDALVLNDYFGKSPVEYWFAKIHGFLMIFAWLFMAPVASFTVRYLKGTFTNRRMYRYKYTFWFAIHGTLAAATIFVTLASVILLMGVDAHWIYEPEKLLSAHSILGFIIFFLLLAQMGLAYSMVKRPEKFKKLHLNFVHGVFGHVLVLCGCS
ncbi:unnamed protein product [Orchesella dallaii]|uniref:Cytochrome b561 domain-containing protein n=1 Tax=Orchesella dallaii TaxID=48710 RepID=A0ABP1RBY3_9HEXA